MPDEKQKTLAERLDDTMNRRRAEAAQRRDSELLAHAQTIRTLQGMLGPTRVARHICSKCGHEDTIIDPRPMAPDDDYDTRA